MLSLDIANKLLIKGPYRGHQGFTVAYIVIMGLVIIFFLVHFLIDDIFLGDAQCATSTLLVDLGGTSGRLYAGLETAVASS